MAEAIYGPDEMSPYAPRVISVKIPVDKIGEVIGPKGKMINSIQADTGADISIEDDGTIYIGATNGPAADVDRAVVLDRDVRAGIGLDRVDHLTLGPDHLADLVHRNLDRDHPGGVPVS